MTEWNIVKEIYIKQLIKIVVIGLIAFCVTMTMENLVTDLIVENVSSIHNKYLEDYVCDETDTVMEWIVYSHQQC